MWPDGKCYDFQGPHKCMFDFKIDADDIRRTHELAEQFRWPREEENDGSGPIFASLLYG